MSKKKAVKSLETVSGKIQATLDQAKKNQQAIMDDPTLSDGSGWQKTALLMKSPIPGLEVGLEIVRASMQELATI
jgi:hypothetical protein